MHGNGQSVRALSFGPPIGWHALRSLILVRVHLVVVVRVGVDPPVHLSTVIQVPLAPEPRIVRHYRLPLRVVLEVLGLMSAAGLKANNLDALLREFV